MTEQFQNVQFVTITEDNHLQRLDNFLTLQLKGVPKGKIYKILRKGEVRVNKKRAKPDYKLQIGDEVRIPPIRLETAPPEGQISKGFAQMLSDAILYEDDRIIVINKPSGVAVHGGSGVKSGVIEGLRASREAHQYLELVHRIDRDTSGCLLVAKKRSALRHLHEQLRNKQMNKVYHALVKGNWPHNLRVVEAPLEKNTLQGGERVVMVNDNGKESKTKFTLLKTHEKMSLVEARPITGRTHQIRVHCLHAGYPIANDDKYGDKEFDKYVKSLGCNRLCLHAYQLTFIHPVSEEVMTFTADYDDQLNNAVKSF
ncbi:23S rRNA pseudouridine(955/2504/2580) synthase RluC [Glaciecola sp. 1036]|uniref:23S rRNA pseudouridine(955/2504/2580) synthase RluC n=1 Tax=Alteromonadaceae TaxID=72275 RepID=UPI003D0719F6